MNPRCIKLCVSTAAIAPITILGLIRMGRVAETADAAVAKVRALQPQLRGKLHPDAALTELDEAYALQAGPELHAKPSPKAPEPGALRLTSVMTSAQGSVAVIDGRIRRVSDRVDDQWTVRSIDHAAGIVLLLGADGAEKTLRLRE